MNEFSIEITPEASASQETGEASFWGTIMEQASDQISAKNDGDPDLLAVSAVAEIEKLMGELLSARDYLTAEAERVKRENARLGNLSRTALASVHIISDNLSKWRENDKAA